MTAVLQLLLALAGFELLVALACALKLRRRAERGLGAPVERVVARRRPHRAGVLMLLALALLATGVAPLSLAVRWMAVLAVLLAVALEFLTPEPFEQLCAEGGVRLGFDVARFEEFSEWRLTGDHLRFRLTGRDWLAVRLEARHHPALRATLEERAAGRESERRA